MKYFLLAPVLLFAMAFTATNKESEKNPTEYHVTYCTRDTSIASGQARIEFYFMLPYGVKANDSIQISYNGTYLTLSPDRNGKANLNLSAGKYVFQFYYNSRYDEIYTDSILIKSGCRTGINVTFDHSLQDAPAEKPVIYVYPDVTKNINITLNVEGNIGYTYPQYKNGWNFVADPDGTIHMNEKEYDYLFWDGVVNVNYANVDMNSGFVVQKDSLTAFFEEKLSAMGLSPREQQDFITYWVPQMQVNENSFVHFMFNEEYSTVADLNVTPRPDHIFRVFMLWNNSKDMNTNDLREQNIESFSREGFTIVEWGGAQLGKRNNNLSAK